MSAIPANHSELAVTITVRPAPDYRDLAIEALADREAELLERIAQMEASIAIWRLMFVEALGHGHQMYRDLAMVDRRQYVCKTRSRLQHDEEEIPW
jgi:hypothetical protein